MRRKRAVTDAPTVEGISAQLEFLRIRTSDVYSGHPMVSDPQAMMFSPLGLVLRLAVSKRSVYWFDGVVHLLAAGLAPLLNLLGVKYIVSFKSLPEIDPQVDENRFPLVLEHEGLKVWENLGALPGIGIASSIYLEPDLDGAISEGKIAALDYRSTVVLPRLPETLSASLSGQGKSAANLLSYRNTEVIVAVQSERDIIVVLQ